VEEHILVAEDDPSVAALVSELLTDEGYGVRRVPDGQAALAEVERDPPDLLVSDVAMPKLDGLTLAARVRERGIPVVLMSAVVERLPPVGVALVPKPFDLDVLLAAVRRALDRYA
jgi:DNA-binding response OmpR family regulator